MEPKNHYAPKSELLKEIAQSKKKKLKYPKRNPVECLTPRLVDMIRDIVDHFGESSNWRNYCVDPSTECLTQRGWLTEELLTTDDMIMSCDQERLVWSKIKSIYRGQYEGKMFHLTSTGLDAFVTPGHKFLTHEGLKPVEKLLNTDTLVLMRSGFADYQNRDLSVADVDFFDPFEYGKDGERVATVPYSGLVWCPETEYGNFVCRRNGLVYITGNTFLDDMKSRATAAVCNNALKFNPEKSDAPFNYYTMIAHRTFLTHIEEEKKHRELRDDLIEAYAFNTTYRADPENSLKPSFARQGKEEHNQLGGTLDGTRRIPMKRGRFRRRKSHVLDSVPQHTIDSEPVATED